MTVRLVDFSVHRWKREIILIALQALFVTACSTQQAKPPQFVEEMAKQEKIYGSRGTDVPSGYVTSRSLSGYAELLPSGFCDTLGTLGSSHRWLDIGAGAGQAILDYYTPAYDAEMTSMCTRFGEKAWAVAMSIEDRRTEKWQQVAASVGGDRIRYLAGKRLRQYSTEDLGKFQIITDVYGGFSYTEDLAGFLNKVMSLLETGGSFYTLVQSVHLEDGSDNPKTTWYLTELVDEAGQDVKVCSWLKNIPCVKVVCESKSDWHTPTELINVQKVCGNVTVPRTKLVKFESGNPPGRRFQIER